MLFANRIYNSADSLRLCQRHFSVYKGAAGKFARKRYPRTVFQSGGQKLLGYQKTAVAIKLGNVFTREGVGTLEQNTKPVVENTLFVGKAAVIRVAVNTLRKAFAACGDKYFFKS